MELNDLQQIWKQNSEKLDRNWQLNLELIRRTKLDKVKNKMRRLIRVNTLTLIFYLTCTIVLAGLIVKHWSVAGVAIAGSILALWTLSISIAAMYELELITSIDYTQPISILQKKLSQLKMTMIRYLRLGVWIFPLYFVFIILMFWLLWGVDIVAEGDRGWIIGNILISVVVFLPLAVWAHFKLSPKNVHTKWMNALLGGAGSQISDALQLIEEIEDFEGGG